jgi:uncharacterized protein YaiL (DUF2058 family)
MRLLFAFAVLVSLSAAVPAFSQNELIASGAAPAPAPNASISAPAATATPASAAAPESASVQTSLDFATLRESVARQNKVLSDQIEKQKADARRNEMILRDARKIAAANKKLEEESKRIDAQNAQLDKERASLLAAQKSTGTEPVNQTGSN